MLFERRFYGVIFNEIDFAAKLVLQFEDDADIVEQAEGVVQIDKNVDIAILFKIASNYRTEKGGASCPPFFEDWDNCIDDLINFSVQGFFPYFWPESRRRFFGI